MHIAKLKAALLEARKLLRVWGPDNSFWIEDVCDPLLREIKKQHNNKLTRLAPVSGSTAGQSRTAGITKCKICGCGGLPSWGVFCETCAAQVRDLEEQKDSESSATPDN
jgi:hypothetical protein